MALRTNNIVVSFMATSAASTAMSTEFNVSTHGYRSPNSPYRFAAPRLRSNIVLTKSIGCLFWNERSGVEFGAIDIAINDGGKDYTDSQVVNWIAWANETASTQAVISVQQSDGTLTTVAVVESRDISFPDDNTIRIRVQPKHQFELDSFINTYYSGVNDELDDQPIPIYYGAGGIAVDIGAFSLTKVIPTTLRDESTLRYDVTDLDLVVSSPSPYRVLDRGVELEEGMSPGFTIVDNGFELSANPDGKITFGWAGNFDGGVEDPFETGVMLQGMFRICRHIVDRSGIDVATSFPAESAFDGLQLGEVYDYPLVFYTREVTAREVLNDIMDGIGGWWYVDELGDFQFGQLMPPENVSNAFAAYSDKDMIGTIRIERDKAPGLSTRAQYGWRPGFYQQDELAGSVNARLKLSKEWGVVETGETVPSFYQDAAHHPPMTIKNAGTGSNPSYLTNELARRWTQLYHLLRRFYTFSIPIRGDEQFPALGDTVRIQSDQFDVLNEELAVYVRRIKMDLGAGLLTIDGWGGAIGEPAPPVTQWGPYASIAAAEASGDPWENGDIILITSGPDMLYFSGLAVDGHSGLIHRDPFDEGDSVPSVSVHLSETTDSDPITWTGFTNGSTGVNGTDYDINVDGGKNNFEKLNSTGRPYYRRDGTLDANDTTTFAVVDAVEMANPDAVAGIVIQLGAYDADNPGTRIHRAALYAYDNGAAGHDVNNYGFRIADDPGFTLHDLGIAFTEVTRFWIYARGDKNAIYDDNGTLLVTTSIPPTTTVLSEILYLVGNTPDATLCQVKHGYIVSGRIN